MKTFPNSKNSDSDALTFMSYDNDCALLTWLGRLAKSHQVKLCHFYKL